MISFYLSLNCPLQSKEPSAHGARVSFFMNKASLEVKRFGAQVDNEYTLLLQHRTAIIVNFVEVSQHLCLTLSHKETRGGGGSSEQDFLTESMLKNIMLHMSKPCETKQ